MKIYLIRHGETTGDLEDRYGGDYDDHLTKTGEEQAKKLAEKLVGKDLEIIFASPRLRAMETGELVRGKLEIPLEIIEDLRERNNYGILTGLTKKEAKEKYPQEFEKISKDKIHHNVNSSESYDQIKARTIAVFKDIFSRDYDTIAIITHGGVISTFVREVLKLGEMEYGDCSILEIEKRGKNFKLNCLDSVRPIS